MLDRRMPVPTNTVVIKRGLPVLPMLGLIFITLKLTGYITWSWWWVTAPFWGMIALPFAILAVWLALAAGVLAIGGIGIFVYNLFQKRKTSKHKSFR